MRDSDCLATDSVNHSKLQVQDTKRSTSRMAYGFDVKHHSS
jgi:hypothetical protein